MDIGSKNDWPSGALSNFSAFAFELDGVKCASMEGFLQSLKSENVPVQNEICQLIGKPAKKWGQAHNIEWKLEQKLWWQGRAYDRHGQEYQNLLDRAYEALSKNEEFRKALLATGNENLTHSIGQTDPRETILTEQEFCSRLMRLRSTLLTQNETTK
jgi:predicted NAD-dependent protein-ADP-ribosyltransferase YbiA (DUF1768 family)